MSTISTFPTAGLAIPSASTNGRSPLDAALFERAQGSGKTSRASDFRAILGKIEPKDGETPEQTARRSAESFVAIAFVQPLIKQLRETNQAAPPFAPTEGEKTFRGLMDAQLAQDLVTRGRFPLVDKVTESLMKKTKAAAAKLAEGSDA